MEMNRPQPESLELAPRRAWDGYLVGPENAVAHAAALGLVRRDPTASSPLLVVGRSGAGKSRLLRELLAHWRERHPDAAAELWTGETFANARREEWDRLRERGHELELLMIDGLDPIVRLSPAAGMLEHLVESLDRAGSKIVLTMSRTGDAALRWPPRLRSLLSAGMTVRLELPGAEMRRRFLLGQLTERGGIALGAEVIDALADAARDFRMLEGWVTRLAFAARQRLIPRSGPEADRAALTLVGDELQGTPYSPPSVEEIAKIVARAFAVPLRELLGPARRRSLVVPRHLAIYLARVHTGASFATLGRVFGTRDSKTIRHACVAAAARLQADPLLAAKAEALLAELPGLAARSER
jgi:chromosomal replication initiator protein